MHPHPFAHAWPWSPLLLLVLWLAGLGGPGAAAGSPVYVPVGSTITWYDFFTHLNTPERRTFPAEDLSCPIGMQRLSDGTYAAIYQEGFSAYAGQPRLLRFTLDVNATPPWAAIDAPQALTYSGDAPPPNELGLSGGLTEYTQGRLATAATWNEKVYVDGVVDHIVYHAYIMLLDKTSGALTKLCELQPLPGDTVVSAPWDLVYLPARGSDPEAFILSYAEDDNYCLEVVNTAGGHIRTIDFSTLHLAKGLMQCKGAAMLEPVGHNGWLVGVGLSENTAAECAGQDDWPNQVCFYFDQFGNYYGAWGYGAAMPTTPFLPFSVPRTIAMLPNGDILGANFFALYDTRAGANYGDANCHVVRHFIVRPPTALYYPKLTLGASSIDFGTVASGSNTTQGLVAGNVGFAELRVSECGLAAPVKGLAYEGDGAFALTPSTGLSAIPGTTRSLTLRFAPSAPGYYAATLRLKTNDPTATTKDVPVAGFAVPPGYQYTTLFNLDALAPLPDSVSGLNISADGQKLLVAVAMQSAGEPYYSRVAALPIRRAGGRVTGFDTASSGTLVNLAPPRTATSVYPLSDGTLWCGPDSSWAPKIRQRLADGRSTETVLDASYEAPIDFQLAPGGGGLLMSRLGRHNLQLFDLVKNTTTGFYTLALRRTLPHSLYVHDFELWTKDTRTWMLLASSDLWLASAPLDYVESATQPPAMLMIARGTGGSLRFCRDPETGDILLIRDRTIQRLDGYLGFGDPSTPSELELRGYLLGSASLSSDKLEAADLNHDGRLDVADLVRRVSQ